MSFEEQNLYWANVGTRRDPGHPVIRAFAEPKLDFVLKTFGASRGTLLEIGAGNGFFSVGLEREFALTALDFSRRMLDMNPLPADRKVLGRAEALPFPDQSFDVAFCANLLHHLDEPLDAVREMRRVARRHVVILEPNALNPLMFLFGALKREERGTLKFTRRFVEELGHRAGLALEAATTQGFVLPNKTPPFALPLLRKVDRASPLGFYHVAVFRCS